MFRRYSFLPVFLILLASLAWWARHVESSVTPAVVRGAEFRSEGGAVSLTRRRELLEALDRIVAYEHYYRSVYGHFTKFLSRIGYTLPRSVQEFYEIRVVEAASDRLLITALSEVDGKTADLVSVDHEYQLHSNFALPTPRPEFLRGRVLRHLRALRDWREGVRPDGEIEELGIYRGYFTYEIKRDSRNRRIAFAVGVRPPVAGMRLEVGADDGSGEVDLLGFEEDEELGSVARTGQQQAKGPYQGPVMTTLEEAYLAQRIFRGEIGRSAKSWNELSRIANFRFEEKAQYGVRDVPFGDTGAAPEIEAGFEGPLVGVLEALRHGEGPRQVPEQSLSNRKSREVTKTLDGTDESGARRPASPSGDLPGDLVVEPVSE